MRVCTCVSVYRQLRNNKKKPGWGKKLALQQSLSFADTCLGTVPSPQFVFAPGKCGSLILEDNWGLLNKIA